MPSIVSHGYVAIPFVILSLESGRVNYYFCQIRYKGHKTVHETSRESSLRRALDEARQWIEDRVAKEATP